MSAPLLPSHSKAAGWRLQARRRGGCPGGTAPPGRPGGAAKGRPEGKGYFALARWAVWQALQSHALASFWPAPSLPSTQSLQAATMTSHLAFHSLSSPLGGLFWASAVYSSSSCFFSASSALPEATFFSRLSLPAMPFFMTSLMVYFGSASSAAGNRL